MIDIDRARLPAAAEVASWEGPRLAAAIRHLPADPRFNPHVRQLLHVSFKVAAKQGARYTDLLVAHRDGGDDLLARHAHWALDRLTPVAAG